MPQHQRLESSLILAAHERLQQLPVRHLDAARERANWQPRIASPRGHSSSWSCRPSTEVLPAGLGASAFFFSGRNGRCLIRRWLRLIFSFVRESAFRTPAQDALVPWDLAGANNAPTSAQGEEHGEADIQNQTG